jgi:hypothetical protein
MENPNMHSHSEQKSIQKTNQKENNSDTTPLPYSSTIQSSTQLGLGDAPQSGLWCPNCGAVLEARKCKLFCHTPGCGYLVTCSEW